MNRPVIGRVGRQPIVSVSASVRTFVRVCGPSVCVALQSRGGGGGGGVCSSDSHCFTGLTAVPPDKDLSPRVKARTQQRHA